LYDQIEKALPQELIDIICKYLAEDNELAEEIPEYVYDCATEADPEVEHLVSYVLDPAYVGKHFAASMTKAAYKATIPGVLYLTDGDTLFKIATFDPFELGITPAPYMKKIFLQWGDLNFANPEIGVEFAIKALGLLRPSNDLQITIMIDRGISWATFQDGVEYDLAKFLVLFKPVHKRLIRGMGKDEYWRLRESTVLIQRIENDMEGYPDGLPYFLKTPFKHEIDDYFRAETEAEELVIRQDLMKKVLAPQG
jgi:hypothetical protein